MISFFCLSVDMEFNMVLYSTKFVASQCEILFAWQHGRQVLEIQI